MDEDEIWDALEELWRDEKVEHVPTVGDVDEHHFSLTDEGTEYARDLLRENDEGVLMLVQLVLQGVDRPGDTEAVSEALVEFGVHLRDDVGVNVFRVLRRHSEEVQGIDVEDLPEAFIEDFDPEVDDDE